MSVSRHENCACREYVVPICNSYNGLPGRIIPSAGASLAYLDLITATTAILRGVIFGASRGSTTGMVVPWAVQQVSHVTVLAGRILPRL